MDAPSPVPPADPQAAPAARPLRVANLKMMVILSTLSVAMLVAGFTVLPDFYRLLCERVAAVPNPGGTSASTAAAAPGQATGRRLEVFFEARIFDRVPVRFLPKERAQVVEVGGEALNHYVLRNLTDQPLRIHPIHQVDPVSVGKHFTMNECFCFTDMLLAPGEAKELRVRYTFAPTLDERIKHVTICYSLFAVDKDEPFEDAKKRIKAQVEGQGAIVTPQYQDPAP